MGSMRRLMDYVSKTRLIIWAVLIVTCLAMSFEASCTIWVKNGILSVEYGRCWSLVKTVRMMPVSEINSVSVACGGGKWRRFCWPSQRGYHESQRRED